MQCCKSQKFNSIISVNSRRRRQVFSQQFFTGAEDADAGEPFGLRDLFNVLLQRLRGNSPTTIFDLDDQIFEATY